LDICVEFNPDPCASGFTQPAAQIGVFYEAGKRARQAFAIAFGT
jgi:hypothetical protein